MVILCLSGELADNYNLQLELQTAMEAVSCNSAIFGDIIQLPAVSH